jgi:biotin carboxyl carrier protein
MTGLLDDRPVGLRGSGPYTVDERTIVAGESAGRWAVDGEEGIAARDGTDIWVKWRGETYVLDTAGRQRSVDALAGTEITAPMPGVVLAVHARAGDRLKRGDLVCVVEAMKMELRVEAPGDGTVTKVLCAAGDQVKRGQRLAEFEGA